MLPEACISLLLAPLSVFVVFTVFMLLLLLSPAYAPGLICTHTSSSYQDLQLPALLSVQHHLSPNTTIPSSRLSGEHNAFTFLHELSREKMQPGRNCIQLHLNANDFRNVRQDGWRSLITSSIRALPLRCPPLVHRRCRGRSGSSDLA